MDSSLKGVEVCAALPSHSYGLRVALVTIAPFVGVRVVVLGLKVAPLSTTGTGLIVDSSLPWPVFKCLFEVRSPQEDNRHVIKGTGVTMEAVIDRHAETIL